MCRQRESRDHSGHHHIGHSGSPNQTTGRRAELAHKRVHGLRVGLAGLMMLPAAACTGGDDKPATPQTTNVIATTTPARQGDGILTIGLIVPITGEGAALGNPVAAEIQARVEKMNEPREDGTFGVLDNRVQLRISDEAGDRAFDDLLASNVDAIIGPMSSKVALGQLGAITEPGNEVVTCSPSATAIKLDDFPSNYFVRTVPSDSLQMAALAQQARKTGAATISIAYLDDPYGRGLDRALRGFIQNQGAQSGRPPTLAAEVGFSGDEQVLTSVVDQLLADDPGVIAILGDANDGGRLLTAIDERLAAANADRPTILVNDTIRTAGSAIAALTTRTRSQLFAIAPQSRSKNPESEELYPPFVGQAVDCLNLIALAVQDAGSDAPPEFLNSVAFVSGGGQPCFSFVECNKDIHRRIIDYQGLSGSVDLSSKGDPLKAQFDVIKFRENGTEETAGSVEGTAG